MFVSAFRLCVYGRSWGHRQDRLTPMAGNKLDFLRQNR